MNGKLAMLRMLDGLKWRKTGKRHTPEGMQIFAVSDVHGCKEQMLELLQLLKTPHETFSGHTHLVFLGDLIDRGPDSRGVLEYLSSADLPADEVTFLMGNHEEFLLDCYDGKSERYSTWLRHGGFETMSSYGVSRQQLFPDGQLNAVMKRAIPPAHVALMRSFQNTLMLGDYLFVHAGVRPGKALEDQSTADLRWITNEFLTDKTDHGFTVVHGHTITSKVNRRSNRIGIDTGCYESGVLSALILEGDESFFLATGQTTSL